MKAARELASQIRAFQGSSRCQYKAGHEPAWWPSEVSFINTSKLSASDVGLALKAAKQHQGNSDSDKSEDADCALEVENGVEQVPLKGERLEGPEHAKSESKLADLSGESADKSGTMEADSSPRPAQASGEDVPELNKASVEAEKETGKGKPSPGVRDDSCAMPPPRPRQPAAHHVEQRDVGGRKVKDQVTSDSVVPRTPVSRKAATRNWLSASEKAALIEDAERRTMLSIEELRIGVEERQKRFSACFKFKQDDVRDAVELIVQRMPRHIQDMPIDEYILQFGGDHRNVVVSNVQDAVESHMRAVVEKRKHALGEPALCSPEPANGKSSLRSIADEAAKTARKNAPPATSRRTTRRAAKAKLSVRRPNGSGTAKLTKFGDGAAATAKLARAGGIVKAIPNSRAAVSAGKKSRLFSAVDKENVEVGDGCGSSDEDVAAEDSPSIIAQMRAHEKELQALRKKLEMTRRRRGERTTRKLR